MIYTIYISVIALAILSAVGIFILNYRELKRGSIEVVKDDQNIKLFQQYLLYFYKFIIRKITRTYKFMTQYALHIVVRVLYIINILTDKVYAKSRNVFVKNATQNRSTVTHFWDHLKVYKREIDKEQDAK